MAIGPKSQDCHAVIGHFHVESIHVGRLSSSAPVRASGGNTRDSSLKSAALLDLMKKHLEASEGEELKQKVGFVYQLNIAPKRVGLNEEKLTVDLKNGTVSAGPSEGKPDATFSFTDADFVSVATGKLNPQMAFIRGKMKIKGSMKAAQKFTPDIFPKPAKL